MYLSLKKYSPVVFIVFLTVFFSTYKLSESPRTWMDEGIITQVSKNIAEHSKHALQIAPEKFVSAGIVSTGYPVTYPISVSFSLFGAGILQARSVMVIFILILILSVFFYLKRREEYKVAFWGTMLVATFSPLYGHGKNVLGEIPGLVFFVLLLLLVDKITDKDNPKYLDYVFLGVLSGLVFSTKPIFILLLPALLVVYLKEVYSKKISWNNKHIIYLASFFGVALVWFLVQFNDDSLSYILSVYSNPHSNPILESIKSNIILLISESQPLYFLMAFLTWVTALIYRIKNKINISSSELVAFIFSFLVLLAFLRTAGFYRYFFLSQFFSLVYFLPSINHIFGSTRIAKYTLYVAILLVVFHSYQTMFNSWVASYYKGNRTQQIQTNLYSIKAKDNILLYQVPEFVIFLKNSNYYQYMDITPTIKLGESNKELIKSGFFDKIFINDASYYSGDVLFRLYSESKRFDSYVVLERI